MLLTTHNLGEAEHLCDQVAVIQAGRLIAQGPPRSLHQESRTPGLKVFGTGLGGSLPALLLQQSGVLAAEQAEDHLHLRLAPDGSVGELLRLILEQGGRVTEVIRDRTRLQEAYVQLLEEGSHD